MILVPLTYDPNQLTPVAQVHFCFYADCALNQKGICQIPFFVGQQEIYCNHLSPPEEGKREDYSDPHSH